MLQRVCLVVVLAANGCGSPADRPGTAPLPRPVTAARAPLVVFLGDSLTAGWNLDEPQAYPALIEKALQAQGRAVRVLNAGVSGDTTAGGLARLEWILKQKPDLVVVALGANDGLRGLDLGPMESNLKSIVEGVKRSGAKPLLVGMKIPPNMGDYAARFAAVYPKIARETGVPLVAFLLEGVAGRADRTFPDGIHPTAEGHVQMTTLVLPAVVALLEPRPQP